MLEILEKYLEEIGHFLSGREERDEILSEIKSHVLEKAEAESGGVTAESLKKIIAAYGAPRRIAEKYLDDRPIIAPAYKRFLFRYTTVLFAFHFGLTILAVIFRQSFLVFPFLFIPRLGIIEAVMYLPTAFLTDLGIVALVMYFITQSGKDIRLPWPKLAVDLDEVKPPPKGFLLSRAATLAGLVVTLGLTGFAIHLYVKFHTIFFANLNFVNPRPLFTPEAGRRWSLIIIFMLATGTVNLGLKLFTRSRWVDVASSSVSLVLIGLLLRLPFDNPFAISLSASLLSKIKFWITFALLFIAGATTIDLIKNLIIIGRRKLKK